MTVQKLSAQTLVPIGVVAGVIVLLAAVSWTVATDLQRALSDIDTNKAAVVRHETELRELRVSMQYVREAMIRVEAKLGTLPGSSP